MAMSCGGGGSGIDNQQCAITFCCNNGMKLSF